MGRPPLNLAGQNFGKLTVTDHSEHRDGRIHWRCTCECGTEVYVTVGNLRNGKTNSCGCIQVKHDLKGRRFGRLVAMEATSFRGPRQEERAWLCRCDCGTTKVIRTHHLLNGHTESCGCYRSDVAPFINRTHGMKGTKVYSVWTHLIQRCTNRNDKAYKDYGGRGIAVCDRWHLSFENFLADVGEPPADDLTLDRKDNDKGYEPGNVHWVDMATQARNRRNTRMIEAWGEAKRLTDWASDRRSRVTMVALWWRLENGWEAERAISTTAT